MELHSMSHYISLPTKRLMKAKLLDVQFIEGVYIDRARNGLSHKYDFQQITKEKFRFTKKPQENTNFTELF